MLGRKVAVVGMGGAFPHCKDIAEFERKMFAGESLIREWDQAKVHGKNIRSIVSGYIADEEMDIEAIRPEQAPDLVEVYVDKLGRIPDINLATSDISAIWGMLATQDAIKMAGWTTAEVQSEQTGVVMGSGGSGNVLLRPAWYEFFYKGRKTRQAGSHTVDRSMGYREAANVSCLIKNKGVCEAIVSACATGLGNIGYAYRLIAMGYQDRIITGGMEPTALETFIGFDAMQILSRGFAPEASSRPFDMARNGFVCSFGCGIVALEEYEMAKARGAKILGVIDSYFNNCDGDGNMFYPSYDGQLRLWDGVLKGTGKRPDVVKVHGTGTPVGDAVELLSVIDKMGDSGYHVATPKSQFGHMLGAAGSVEFITALLMLQRQECLPCKNSDNLNTEQERFQLTDTWNGPMGSLADYRHLLPQDTIAREINSVMCLNYGFGGTNSALLLSRDN